MAIASVKIPAGMTHLRFDEISDRLPRAQWLSNEDPDHLRQAASANNYDDELAEAVKSGALPVKDPLTFGPYGLPIAARRRAVSGCDCQKVEVAEELSAASLKIMRFSDDF